MSERLPPPLRDVVDATIAHARLTGAERERVLAELESHFRDGIEAGVPADVLAVGFGDPAIAGRLIRRTTHGHRQLVSRVAAIPLVLAASLYSAAVLRVQTAPELPKGALAEEASLVTNRVAYAETLLGSDGGIKASYAVAADLRRRRSFWSEIASIVLLDRVMTAADSMLRPAERRALRDSLRQLEVAEGLAPRRAIVAAGVPTLVDRVYGTRGRIDRTGRRLLRDVKGGGELPAWALLVEPLYFAMRMRRPVLADDIRRLLDERLAVAEQAARRVAAHAAT